MMPQLVHVLGTRSASRAVAHGAERGGAARFDSAAAEPPAD
jgi:hypothetical protein